MLSSLCESMRDRDHKGSKRFGDQDVRAAKLEIGNGRHFQSTAIATYSKSRPFGVMNSCVPKSPLARRESAR